MKGEETTMRPNQTTKGTGTFFSSASVGPGPDKSLEDEAHISSSAELLDMVRCSSIVITAQSPQVKPGSSLINKRRLLMKYGKNNRNEDIKIA